METQKADYTYGIVSYLTLIGWIISIVQLNTLQGEDRKFTVFHLKQALIFMIAGIAISIVASIVMIVPFLGILVYPLVSLGLLGVWIYMLYQSSQGKKTYLPLIGEPGEKMLGNMFEN
ncbi:MAG TPA: hypothetical protein PLI97_09750 [Fluviicola sp.]|nr:hypothetical protein [Fluviicola sp.]